MSEFEYPADAVHLKSLTQWTKWLKANHAKSSGIFLILDKKSTGMRLDYQEILETAICFSWIDEIRNLLLNRLTSNGLPPGPRRVFGPRSIGTRQPRSSKADVCCLGAFHLSESRGLSGQNRYAFVFRLQTAHKPQTRAKRLATFLAMLENQRAFHP